jgi:hypothetical protein
MRIKLAIVLTLAGALNSMAAPLDMVSLTGANAAGIQTGVNQFRTDLGTLNPNVAGSFGSGRREINWDGVPAGASAPNNFPGNFFNSNSPRGVVYTGGAGFQVSGLDDPNTAGNEARFGNINPNYAAQFQTFSPAKLFTVLGDTAYDVNFFVAGSNTPATVSGFGAIFVDVDLANTSSLEFFDLQNNSLGKFFAGTQDGGFSFLGAKVAAGDPGIARVRVTTGNIALGPNEDPNAASPTDVVVVDDFIFGEPVGAPEPASLLLCGAGLVGVAMLRRRKQ